MTALSALHATRSAAGLSQEEARPIYERLGLPASTKAMSDAQAKAARDEIVRLYPDAAHRPSKESRTVLEGPYAKKLQALWIGAWNLGLVRSRQDAALIAFVKRQTGIDHTRWLHDSEDAKKAVEALKKWMARDGGVEWRNRQHEPDFMLAPGYKIAKAQFRLVRPELSRTTTFVPAFREEICSLSSGKSLAAMSHGDWIEVMNALGKRVRARNTQAKR